MTKLKKGNKGMFIMSIGFLFSAIGMILMVNGFVKLPLIMFVLGVSIIAFGFFKMLKENGKI